MSKPVKLTVVLVALVVAIAGSQSRVEPDDRDMEITRYSISIMDHEVVSFSITNSDPDKSAPATSNDGQTDG